MLRAVVEAVGDRAHVVAGVGSYDTAHAIALGQSRAGCGVDGLLAVTPYYNKPPQDGSARPLPGGRRLHRPPGDALRHPRPHRHADRDRHPGPARPSTRGSSRSRTPRATCTPAPGCCARPTWRSTAATTRVNFPWLALGAVGVVSVVGHVAGRRYADMIAAVDAGDLDTAREIDRSILPAVRAIMTRTQGAIMVKAALELQGVLTNRMVRLPLVAGHRRAGGELAPTSRAPSSSTTDDVLHHAFHDWEGLTDEPPAP